MIVFKTYEEQIAILQQRGMIINDTATAKKLLKQNNYYNLINGYKDIFIQTGKNPETYIQGVTFEEIYSLHQFDKALRLEFSHVLIIIEREFGSILAHEFSRIHPNHNKDYLDPQNYNSRGLNVIEVSQLINDTKGLNQTLINAINDNDPMICHYDSQYGAIPLWVFVNKLSFGTLSKMYKLMQFAERDAIAKSIGDISKKKIFADDIQKSISVLVLLRNKCAHDQRVYDFSPGKTTVKWSDFLQRYLTSSDNKNTLFGAIGCISVFLTPTEFNILTEKIRNLTNNFLSTIHSLPATRILSKMGMPQSFLE